MAEDRHFRAHVQNLTHGRLSLKSDSIPWGKFTHGPASQIERSSSYPKILDAKGAKGSATGTEGNVVYVASDGTEFTITWDIPYSASNSGVIRCSGADGRCSAYVFRQGRLVNGAFQEGSFPTSGNFVTRYYQIVYSARAISAQALKVAVGCEPYTEERIRELMTRDDITLQDFFDIKIPAADKIRGIFAAEFLETRDVRALTAEFGERALQSLPSEIDAQALKGILDLYRRFFIDGNATRQEVASAVETLRDLAENGISQDPCPQEQRDEERGALDVLNGMWDDDPLVAANQTLDRMWRLRGIGPESRWQMARVAERFRS